MIDKVDQQQYDSGIHLVSKERFIRCSLLILRHMFSRMTIHLMSLLQVQLRVHRFIYRLHHTWTRLLLATYPSLINPSIRICGQIFRMNSCQLLVTSCRSILVIQCTRLHSNQQWLIRPTDCFIIHLATIHQTCFPPLLFTIWATISIDRTSMATYKQDTAMFLFSY